MASQNKTENLGLCQFGDNDMPDWRTDYTGDMAIIDKQIKDLSDKSFELSDQIEDIKKSVSDGKSEVATAITEQGVATSAADSFHTMAVNISQIDTGKISTSPVINSEILSEKLKTKVTHQKAYVESDGTVIGEDGSVIIQGK